MITIICFVVKINQINKGGWNNSAIQSRSSSILHEKETDRYGRTNATGDHDYLSCDKDQSRFHITRVVDVVDNNTTNNRVGRRQKEEH